MAEKKTSKEVVLHPEKLEDGSPNPNAGQPTGLILFTFSDDSTETFDLGKSNDAMKYRLALHGAGQKIGDSYAGAASDENPLEFAKTAVRETIAQIYAGTWRVGGGGGGPRINELAQAMARATGETLEAMVEFVGAMTDEEKKVYRKKPKVAAKLAEIAAEKAIARAAELAKKAEEEDAKEKNAATPTA